MLNKESEKYRFYAEMPDGRGSKSASKRYVAFTRGWLSVASEKGLHCNVIAVPLEKGKPLYVRGDGPTRMDAFCAVAGPSNSFVEGSTVESGYLRERCVRVSKELALKLHPRMASYLGAQP